MILAPGTSVEYRSLGSIRPYVFFKGKVVRVGTGKWAGTVLVRERNGLPPRHITITRLVLKTPQVARRVPPPTGPRVA